MKIHSTTKASRKWRWLGVSAIFALTISAQLVFAEDNPISAIQQSLKEKHFYFGEIDGIWNDATQGALRRFQFRNGLQGTGEIDSPTLQVLAGKPTPGKATAGSEAQAEVDRWCARQIGRNENPAATKATASNIQNRAVPPDLSTRGRPNISSVAGTEKFPSWSALHGGAAQDAVEVRRAIAITSEASDEARYIPRATLVSRPDSAEKADSSSEIVTMVPAHFTGQDGHIYTYYKQVRIGSPDNAPSRAYIAPTYSLHEAPVALPPEFTSRSGNRGANFAGR